MFGFHKARAATASSSDDAEVDAFLAKEAQEQEATKKTKKKKVKPDEEDLPKLFMQMSWSEQRKAGTNAPVLRQVEGDSVKHRLRIYRRSIFFHIHGVDLSRIAEVNDVSSDGKRDNVSCLQPKWTTTRICCSSCE